MFELDPAETSANKCKITCKNIICTIRHFPSVFLGVEEILFSSITLRRIHVYLQFKHTKRSAIFTYQATSIVTCVIDRKSRAQFMRILLAGSSCNNYSWKMCKNFKSLFRCSPEQVFTVPFVSAMRATMGTRYTIHFTMCVCVNCGSMPFNNAVKAKMYAR